MAKRLTEKQKKDIIQGFESGNSIDFLSKEYKCTKLTIIRNLKKNLGESKYKDLINKKSSQRKIDFQEIEFNNSLNKQFDDQVTDKDSRKLNKSEAYENGSDFLSLDSFFEIAPVDYEIENTSRQELSSVPISEINFPEVVYMIVDKKIELEVKLLKDFPEWEFLPNDDLNRKTIEIYFDLNLAKRSCGKDQKVIKVPNTDVFRIAAPILTSRGISRIVCAENLIAL